MTLRMYGTAWCGDCHRAKAWLDAAAIAYEYLIAVRGVSCSPEQLLGVPLALRSWHNSTGSPHLVAPN